MGGVGREKRVGTGSGRVWIEGMRDWVGNCR